MAKEKMGASEAEHEQLAPPKFESVAQRPQFTPEEQEKIKAINEELKAEHERILREFESFAMEVPESNAEKVQSAYGAMKKLKAEGADEKTVSQAAREWGDADKKLTSRENKMSVLKSLLDQAEIKMGLPADRKLALSKLRDLMQNPETKSLLPDYHHTWVRVGDDTLYKDPIQFDEKGDYVLESMNLDKAEPEIVEKLMSSLPEGLETVRSVSVDDKNLAALPKNIDSLIVRENSNAVNDSAYADRIKKFLGQERHVGRISWSGGSTIMNRELSKKLDSFPFQEVKLDLDPAGPPVQGNENAVSGYLIRMKQERFQNARKKNAA